MGVSKGTALGFERSEARGAISLKSLERAAAALGCELRYSFAPPRGTLEAMVDARARALAEKKLRRVAHSMALENQASGRDVESAQLAQLTAELKRRLPSELWASSAHSTSECSTRFGAGRGPTT